MTLHIQEWGSGDPLIALHPLALESTVFAGAAESIGEFGLRTLSADLPGFGQTPLPELPLTPAKLAEPIIELARRLERPPILLGMSLGGRVAIEVALRAPDAVRGLVLIAPYLPWRKYRKAMRLAEYLNPSWAERLPLERAWPLLQRTTHLLESIPALEHDWLARACVRVAYYSTCPATRTAVLSASRELALDPAYGKQGLWTRLSELAMPVSFLWAGRDRLIPSAHAEAVSRVLPEASQLVVACSGHFVNFKHYRCMNGAIAQATSRILELEAAEPAASEAAQAPCLASGRGGDQKQCSVHRRRRPSARSHARDGTPRDERHAQA
jgi:pimeloyl-ACP methyl ester carboxylesterase